jgi:hypothetical protein
VPGTATNLPGIFLGADMGVWYWDWATKQGHWTPEPSTRIPDSCYRFTLKKRLCASEVSLPGCRTAQEVALAIAMDIHCEMPGVRYTIQDRLTSKVFEIPAPIDRSEAIGLALPELEIL